VGRAALIVAVLALTAVAVADAKPGARARLTSALPLGGAQGTTIQVKWQVEIPGNNGGRPFDASGVFVRLLSRSGGMPTTGFASGGTHPNGRYAANVEVPEGGVGGIRVGLHRSTDASFPLDGDPFRSPGGVRCDVAALRRTLVTFVETYNTGDLRRLDRLFSRERFVWFSAGGRARGNRQTLMSFLRHRHHNEDTLRSLTYRFNGYERERDLGHFELHAERRAYDLQGGQWFEMTGKGALDCAEPPVTIAVLALGSA
jgi:hypothetical protein